MDSVTGLVKLNYYKRSLIIRTKLARFCCLIQFFQRSRVALHLLSKDKGRYSTLKEHMTSEYRYFIYGD